MMNVKIIFSFVLLSMAHLALGQNEIFVENQAHMRIPLNNRTNQYLKDIPTRLLEGYAKGTYKAYYPMAQFNEVNFGDFLFHFHWAENFNQEDNICGDNIETSFLYKDLFEKFNVFLDFYTYNVFNPTTSLNDRKVDFIQLVFTIKDFENEKSFRGPLFRLDELENIKVKNAKNPYQPFSLKTIFDQGRFYSFEVKKSIVNQNSKTENPNAEYQEN